MGKGEKRGFDGGQKIKGGERTIVVDKMGNLDLVLVDESNIYDVCLGCKIIDKIRSKSSKVKSF